MVEERGEPFLPVQPCSCPYTVQSREGLTSRPRASPASAHHLPDAGQNLLILAGGEISRFPRKEVTHMLGSTTASGRPSARAGAPGHPMRTPSTLRRDPRGLQRMTRGQCGSLHLHWKQAKNKAERGLVPRLRLCSCYIRYYEALSSILRGFAVSAFGRTRWSTPSFKVASIRSRSMFSERVKTRS
jgi:hypothetical protein